MIWWTLLSDVMIQFKYTGLVTIHLWGSGNAIQS